jgi:hydrogenase maturation protease
MTHVLGLGNVLMGDDGFGPSVVHAFESAFHVGPGVEVIDLGTPGLDLTPWLFGAESVVIIDTVKSSASPGTLHMYGERAILRHAPGIRTGPHEPGLKEALLALKFAGRGPRTVTLIGVVPLRTTLGTELSAPVAAAVPRAIDALVALLESRGERVVPRDRPHVASPWWTSTPV